MEKRVLALPELQAGAIRSLISLGDEEPLWRIVVYDRVSEQLLTNLFKVGDLRDLNITLNLQLDSHRDPLPGVTCIYLIEPSPASLHRVEVDFSR